MARKPKDPNRLSDREAKCLAAVNDRACGDCGAGVFFREVARRTRLDQSTVRRAMRSLKRKGFLEYLGGLFSEASGLICGSGYGLTPAGRERAVALKTEAKKRIVRRAA